MLTLVFGLAVIGQHPPVWEANAVTVRLRAVMPDDSRVHFHGVLLGDNRILTARHPLAGAERVEYAVARGWRPCAVIRHDPKCDLALLSTRVRSEKTSLAAWSAAPSDLVIVGGSGKVLAVACEAGGSRRERIDGLDAVLLELDMLSVRGDSGRPVFNAAAELVGIVTRSDDRRATKAIDILEIRYFLSWR